VPSPADQVSMSESPVSSRDQHFFAPGPKRILSLDGGGVRGVITVAFLERIERILSEHEGREVRLGDWFDLVGGTSTGAVIAGALALGYRTADLKHFYLGLAPRVFRRPFWRIMGWHAKFDAEALRQEIEAIVGDRTLDSDDLITGLCVVAKRMDTGSPWIISNNPKAPYWNTPPDKTFIGNRHYRLANLVRASTAAPVYFDPELLPIIDGEMHGLFLDGGVTPHNNPALALFLLTILKGLGICWHTGPEHLLICSIGTGSFRDRLNVTEARRIRALGVAVRALASLIDDASNLVVTLMQWLGDSPTAVAPNSEIGTLVGDVPPGGPMFRFLRYNVMLETEWLSDSLGIQLSQRELSSVRQMDDPDGIPMAYEIGRRAAERLVKLEHFSPAKTPPR
jgi:patatin-like phospholipase